MLVFYPSNFYEIKALEEREKIFLPKFGNEPLSVSISIDTVNVPDITLDDKCVAFVPKSIELEPVQAPEKMDITSTEPVNIPVLEFPPIEFGPPIEFKPVEKVFHCKCGKWWVIKDIFFASPTCPSCKHAMSAWQEFSEHDYRYGDYGPIEDYDGKIIKI